MNWFSRSPYPLTLIVTLSLSACQKIDPAIYDCQKLLEQIQTTVTTAQGLIQGETTATASQSFNLELWLQAADTLKTGAEAIAQLPLRDPQLQTYQAEISDIYLQQAEATYAMVKARQEKNLEAAKAAQSLSQAAGMKEQTIGQSLDDYCQARYQAAIAPEQP